MPVNTQMTNQLNTYTWTTWNTQTAATNDVWIQWAGTVTASNMTTTNQVWVYWNDYTTGTATTQFMGQNAAQQMTQEQLDALARQREQYEALAAKERKAREEAEARAEKLLLENLSLKQRQQYEKDKHFVVERGDRRYRIRRGRSGNVDVIDKRGCITHRLCAHPAEGVPDPDTMLAQKLMLEHDDEHFIRLANRHEAYDRATAVLPALQ